MIRHFLLYLKYRKAVVVNTPEELDEALRTMPPRIVVEGNEDLRAHAAMLAHTGHTEAAALEASTPPAEPGAAPDYLIVPTVGRIRDGYKQRRIKPKSDLRFSLKNFTVQSGGDAIILAVVGILALFIVEWLTIPGAPPRLPKGSRPPAVDLATKAPHAPAHLTAAPETFGTAVAHILIPVFALLAILAFGYLGVLALGLQGTVNTSWKVENRIPGRLIMVRIRTRAA